MARRVPVLVAIVVAAQSYSDGHVGGPERSAGLQPADAPAILSDGATFERPASQGDTQRYETLLTAGDFLEISVSQDQLLVRLSARDPEGAVLHTINVPSIEPLAERLMFLAPVSGRYVAEVYLEPWVLNQTPGREGSEVAVVKRGPEAGSRKYTMQVVALRPATSEDRARAAWFLVLERADKLAQLGTMDGLRQAIPLFREAAAGWRAVGDVALEAETLEALASLTGYFTQFHRDSAAARERLTELYARMGERELEVVNSRHLAQEYYEEGRLAHAKQAVGRALELALTIGLRAAAARSQRELGYYEFELGNYDRARELAQRAQDDAAAIPDRALEAVATWDLARFDELAGDLDAAVTRYRRGLELASGHRFPTALITMWLGFLHLRRGELDEAAPRFEARLAMSPELVQRDQEALTRLGLGDVSRARGDREDARRIYEAAASALEKGAQQFRCIAEQRLGRMDLEDGRLDQARVRFATMLQIARQRHLPPCEAEARAGLADVAARRGDLDAADAEAQRVVDLSEAFRDAAVSLESRSLGFGALAPAYERAIDISMRRAERGDAGSMTHALALNEQALARGLLDRVFEARLGASARVPAALATEHHEVRERWRARLAELQVAMRIRPDAPETKALVDETRALAVQVRDLEARIDASDAKQRHFVRPRPLDIEAIQALLDDDTLLLEYALGDARSYLWVVSPRDIRAFTLAPRAEIEALARRVHERLGRSPGAAKTPDVERRADEEDRRGLTRLVLEPVASLLAGRRLVVVPTGALSLVPFGALPAPGGAREAPPMIARHEIVQIPSATLLGAMRALTAGRPRPSRAAAIFADPIFDAQDPRVRSASLSARGSLAPSGGQRPTAGTSTLSLARLPFSRSEAEAIASQVPAGATTFVGPEATRERALGRALADYRFVHFATHGIVNQDVPGLSSIVLSLVDGVGRPRDGFVMLPDVYDMTLNADIVVLSGCQTALGKSVRGEGPIGLARGFMYAGAPRVVASLWQVNDIATAELMKRFYRGLLVEGLTPAAALRAAQQELAAIPRWASSYFWAPFVLQGDWR